MLSERDYRSFIKDIPWPGEKPDAIVYRDLGFNTGTLLTGFEVKFGVRGGRGATAQGPTVEVALHQAAMTWLQATGVPNGPVYAALLQWRKKRAH